MNSRTPLTKLQLQTANSAVLHPSVLRGTKNTISILAQVSPHKITKSSPQPNNLLVSNARQLLPFKDNDFFISKPRANPAAT